MKKRKTRRTSSFFSSHKFYYLGGGAFLLVTISLLVKSLGQTYLGQQNLQTASRQNILGKEEKNEDQEFQEEKDEEEAEKEDEKLKSSGSSGKKGTLELKTQDTGNGRETEIETLSGQKIKTKVEDDGSSKIEIEHDDFKIKYELQDGQVVTKTEDEEGEEVELENEEMEDLEDEVENELEDEGIKIATEGSGRLTFDDSRISASTNFPLSIDVGTKQLVVNTPAGQKTVTVLPDEAVNNLLMNGIISKLNKSIKTKANLEFKMKNNEPVYEINGLKTYRLFALIPVSRPLTVIVSTETGEVITTEKSFLTDAVDFLSP